MVVASGVCDDNCFTGESNKDNVGDDSFPDEHRVGDTGGDPCDTSATRFVRRPRLLLLELVLEPLPKDSDGTEVAE